MSSLKIVLSILICSFAHQSMAQFTYYEDKKKKATSGNSDTPILFAEGDFGIALPIGDPLRQTFSPGYDSNLGLRVNIYKQKLFLRTTFGYQRFANQPQSGNAGRPSVEEFMEFWNYGFQVQYALKDDVFDDFSISVMLEYEQNDMNNWYEIDGTRIDISEGSNPAFHTGVMLKYKIFYLTLNYKVLEMSIDVTEEGEDLWEESGFNIFNTVADVSAFNVNFGVSYPILRKKGNND